MFRRWIAESGVSRGISTSFRSSFNALDAETPISQPAPASASSSRAAYGAPDAPVMPRKTCTVARPTTPWLLLSLRSLEEDRELAQVGVAERVELRHRRAGVDARRTLEVADLEVDAEILRADVRQVGRAELLSAVTVVGVTGRAAGAREELRARNGV